jgi:hypothetical protein
VTHQHFVHEIGAHAGPPERCTSGDRGELCRMNVSKAAAVPTDRCPRGADDDHLARGLRKHRPNDISRDLTPPWRMDNHPPGTVPQRSGTSSSRKVQTFGFNGSDLCGGSPVSWG